MTDRILVPTDGSDGATAALEHASSLAADRDATVHLLTVVDTNGDGPTADESVRAVFERRGREIVADAADRASEQGVATVEAVERGRPHEAILAYAADAAIDLVVMGTRGRRGLERFFLGSVAERVVRLADVPVLTVRDDGHAPPYGDVLVATDGSACAMAALEQAVSLARPYGATVHLLSVVDVAATRHDYGAASVLSRLERDATSHLEQAATRARELDAPAVETALEVGTVPREITDYAATQDVDLVAVGTHGRQGVSRYVVGSVAERVVRTASRPVLTVRRSKGE